MNIPFWAFSCSALANSASRARNLSLSLDKLRWEEEGRERELLLLRSFLPFLLRRGVVLVSVPVPVLLVLLRLLALWLMLLPLLLTSTCVSSFSAIDGSGGVVLGDKPPLLLSTCPSTSSPLASRAFLEGNRTWGDRDSEEWDRSVEVDWEEE
jgi:hypothetical protein